MHIEKQAEDIRLYKLDVKGYKKDVKMLDQQVRERDSKIRDLQQSVLELQTRLGDKEGEVLPVEVPLGIDLGGITISPVTKMHSNSDTTFRQSTPVSPPSKRLSKPRPIPLDLQQSRKPGVHTPPLSPNKPLPPSPRTPISKYNDIPVLLMVTPRCSSARMSVKRTYPVCLAGMIPALQIR